jgi:hypothetical protein
MVIIRRGSIQERRLGKGICFMTKFIFNIVCISYAQVENSTSAHSTIVALHQEYCKALLFIYCTGKEAARIDNK